MRYKLMALGEVFHDCLTVVDVGNPGRRCLYVNSQFEKATGYSKEEVVGKNLALLQGEKTDPHTVEFMRERFEKREACIQDIINYRKDGSQFLNRLLMLPIKDEKYDLFIGFQNDITELNLRSKGLDLTKVKPSEICHNINNHLTVLIANISLMLNKSDKITNDKLAEVAKRLHDLNNFSLSIEKFSEFENFKYI